jgi:hypothetical protein
MTPIRINITHERFASELPLEYVARAYRGYEYLQVGFGATPLAAFGALLKSLERTYPELDQPELDDAAPATLPTGVEP